MSDETNPVQPNMPNMKTKLRQVAAGIASKLAENVIRPPKPLVEHKIVITAVWHGNGEAILDMVERTKAKARANVDSGPTKFIFGLLRFLGFGCIEVTGESDVHVTEMVDPKAEPGIKTFEVKTEIGVRAEDEESLALAAVAATDKVKHVPAGALCVLLGIKPGNARMIDFQMDVA